MSDAAGLNDAWYFDVEHFDDEVTGMISLDQLIIIARKLRLTSLSILEGPEYPPPPHRLSLAELTEMARQRMLADGLSVEEYSDRIGWEMRPVFADPERIRAYTVDALREICRDVGVDWHAALPEEINLPAG